MSAERDPVEELLASISDGRPADWDGAERQVDPAQRIRLESLRDLSRIADFSRDLQRGPEDSAMPERWGNLLLLERLGTGVHGEVHRAWDPGLQREVALKLIRADVAGSRLLDEGRIAARIRHPHVVTVHGVDFRDGRAGLWMELVRGSTVEQEVRGQGALDFPDVRRLGIEIGSALAAVHAAGLLHRDIKPANIVRDAQGRHVLADFGLGMRWDESGASVVAPSGTPMYMAPELLAGSPASARSDVYSLGMLLWFALTGRHPFDADSLAELRTMASRGPQPGLRAIRPGVPAALAAIVERATAPNPADRFASAQLLVDALEAWRPHRATAPRTPARAAIAVALVALIGVTAFGVWRARRSERAAPAVALPPATVPAAGYAVEASFLRRDDRGTTPLVTGDQVNPGDRLSFEVRTTRPAWIYILNEDERGERYLLFPQPRFDTQNPVAADSTFVLPGTIGGKEQAWTVTSAGGREYLLAVASPNPLPEIEADLSRLPAPLPGRPIDYARIGENTVERLRGVGGITELPPNASGPAPRSRAFDRFRALAGRETGIQGVWVRQIVLENPRR